MKPYGYLRASTTGEALTAWAARPGAQYLAGGTNLVDLMKLGVAAPRMLIDVRRLPLDSVDATPDGGLRIGATVRNSDLAAHPAVRTRYRALSQALLAGASPQLRNSATTGGNLLQRTRCTYFQDVGKPCNKREPGTGCPAVGIHRDLAVLGHSPHCVATHPSDMAVALAAFDATVRTEGTDGPRSLPVTSFHRLPGDRPDVDTELRPGELITAVDLPPAPGVRSVYRKVRDRASYAFALVSVAACLAVEDGRIRHASLAFGGLAHRPWRAWTAEERLLGAAPTAAVFEQAAEAELDAAEPLRDNAFKVRLAGDLAVRVLTELAGEAA
ncbi:FAD binding domain-containing protein [Streptomyces zhihengii]